MVAVTGMEGRVLGYSYKFESNDKSLLKNAILSEMQ